MKKSVKIIIAIVVLALVVGGCVFAFTRESYGDNKKAEVVMITNGSEIDSDNRTKGLWQGVKEYAKENKLKSNYLIPKMDEESSLSTKKIGEYIEIAVNNGAKYIVLPDESFAVAAYEIGSTYKDVNFLLVDAFPHSQGDDTMRTLSNVMPVSLDVINAGFLAGYSLVEDGYTKLGFIGSSKDENTGNYSSGFKQGLTYAAEEKGIDVSLDDVEYDSIVTKFDYNLEVNAVYEPISDDAHKLTVVDGQGSGYYKEGQNVTLRANDAPKDKAFDYWEIKSNTDGIDAQSILVSDKNSSDNATVTIGKGDITVSPVYKDVKTQEITINFEDGSLYKTLNIPENSSVEISCPVPNLYMDLIEWECNFPDAIDNPNAKIINVSVKDKPIVLTPKYDVSPSATFGVMNYDGMGTGAYKYGDEVNLVAKDIEGKMFTKWEISDAYGYASFDDLDLTNPNLKFDMQNMYNYVPKKLYDDGVEVIFTTDSALYESVLDAANNSNGLAYTLDDNDIVSDKFFGNIKYDYRKIVKLAFNQFKGGSIFKASASNDCISITNKSYEAKSIDDRGKEMPNDNYDANFAKVYNMLKDGKLKLVYAQTGADISAVTPSDNVTFNYWVNLA